MTSAIGTIGMSAGLLWTFVLAITVIAVFMLALLPALVEHRWPKDIAPLRVVREFDGNVANFAFGFGNFIETELGNIMHTLDANETREGQLKSGEKYLLIGKTAEISLSTDDSALLIGKKIIAGVDVVKLPRDILFSKEIYAGGDFFCGQLAACRAVLAKGRAELDRDSAILRWIHAIGALTAAPGAQLFGRASSDTSIRLADGVVFERVHAPKILFGDAKEVHELNQLSVLPLADWNPSHQDDMVGNRWRLNGDVVIPVGSRCHAPMVVVGGSLVVGAASFIHAAIKSNGNLTLGESCRCDDAVVASTRLEIGTGCRVKGPLISETVVLLRSGCIIGTAAAPTTITAPRILIEPGAIVYGSVWARERGEVGMQE
jgi:hypothetical protein